MFPDLMKSFLFGVKDKRDDLTLLSSDLEKIWGVVGEVFNSRDVYQARASFKTALSNSSSTSLTSSSIKLSGG